MLALLHPKPLSTFTKPPFLHPQTPTSKPLKPQFLPFSRLSPLTTTSPLPPLNPRRSSDVNIALFHSYGFSDSDVSCITRVCRNLLTADPDRIIKAKLDYLLSFGFSQPELIILIRGNPTLLSVSLNNRIVPNLNFLHSLLGSKEHARTAVRRSSRLLQVNFDKAVSMNLITLQQHGVPNEKIVQIFTKYPRIMTKEPDKITETVVKLKELGMDPKTTVFIVGMNAMSGLSGATWERKLELYRNYGLSDKQTLLAFSKYPYCMLSSESKIRKMLKFFLEELKLDPTYIHTWPRLLCLSLEKRIIPRCSVVELLDSKDLSGQRISFPTYLMISDEDFREKYVDKYLEEIPEIIEAYKGKIEFVET